MSIEVPCDRKGSFEPVIAPKHRFKGFDDKILPMYAPGLTTRQIQEHLKDSYAVEVSPELISRVTGEVKEPAAEWRNRPLEPLYPVVFPDALWVHIRNRAAVVKKPVYLALAIRLDSQKEPGETKFRTGMWIEQNEGASNLWFAFWMGIMNELKNRGVRDILLAAVDGLTGFPGAVADVFPTTEVQLCLRTLVRVHRVRNSLRFVPYKDRKAVTAALKTVYPAPQAEAAAFAPEEFAGTWDKKYPMIAKSWRSRWAGIIPFFQVLPGHQEGGVHRQRY